MGCGRYEACKIEKVFKKILAYFQNIMYTNNCCGMIAMKREVAAVPKDTAGFPWSECQEAAQADLRT